MKHITLTNSDLLALVDDEDFDRVSVHLWSYAKRQRRRYVVRKVGDKVLFLHHEVVGRVPGLDVDHEDGDGLNNQKSNLQHVTRAVNISRSRVQDRQRSGYKGVCWSARRQVWNVLICVPQGGKQKGWWFGQYKSKYDAAFAYNVAIERMRGEHALLNCILPEHMPSPNDQATIRQTVLAKLEAYKAAPGVAAGTLL